MFKGTDEHHILFLLATHNTKYLRTHGNKHLFTNTQKTELGTTITDIRLNKQIKRYDHSEYNTLKH